MSLPVVRAANPADALNDVRSDSRSNTQAAVSDGASAGARYVDRPHVRRQYWNEPTMGTWERVYLLEVVRGLLVTGGVFLRNLGKWMTGRKGALTTYYPEEKRVDYAQGNRGKHVLTSRADKPGAPQCIACNMCATVCPAKVIEIEAGFDLADAAHPKFAARFEIDYSRCVFCGLCVEACPEDAIRMVPEVPDFPGHDRRRMWIGREELLTWRPTVATGKVYGGDGANVPTHPHPSPPLEGEGVGRTGAQA
jgi:NADH-quinone oxidoreductase subunit I